MLSLTNSECWAGVISSRIMNYHICQGYHFPNEVDVHVNKVLVIIITCIWTVLHGLMNIFKYISLFDTIFSQSKQSRDDYLILKRKRRL